MSTTKPRWTGRVLRRFFLEWRSQWVGPSELSPYDHINLALAIGECWQGVISARYPDRAITVAVSGDEDGAYGPTVTFWSGDPSGT